MYLSTVSRPVSTNGSRVQSRVAANVFALGAVSLVTDISSEMVTAILPVYLVVGLHLSPAAYGVLDGLYTGATALLRIVGGFVADRTQRRKLVAGVGYATSALMKPAMLLVGPSTAGIGAVIAFDRAGKGLRSAPRDALITLSSPANSLGRAFGVHRAMDSTGAFLGPLVAIGVLALSGQSFDAVFVASFCIATFAVVLMALYVRDHRDALAPSGTVSLRSFRELFGNPAVRRIMVAASLLGLVTVGDGFIYLLLQKREDLSIAWFPLLAVGTNAAYLLLAAPFGALADRIGRVRVMLGGYVALALVYLMIFGPMTGWPMLVVTLLLHGVFYAATDGVLMALAGPVLPEHVRTTGIAMIQTAQALCYLVSSVAFGLAWQWWGPVRACQVAAVAVVITIGMSALLLRRRVSR